MIIHSVRPALKASFQASFTAIFTVALLISTSLAAATETSPSEDIEACNGSTAEEYECVSVRYVIQRDELEKTYRVLHAKLANDARSNDKFVRQAASEVEKRLERSQRTWIQFMDSDCRLESAELIGSNREDLSLYSCQLERTRDRIKILRDLAI